MTNAIFTSCGKKTADTLILFSIASDKNFQRIKSTLLFLLNNTIGDRRIL